MNIFAGSLPYSIGEAELRQLFEAYGEVSSVKLISDRETGRSKGFGFVEMETQEEAEAAIRDFNGQTLGGRQIVVNASHAREREPGGGGGGRRPNRNE